MSKGPSSQTVTTAPQIPDFLQGFVNQSAGISEGALASLADQMSQPNALVTPFNSLQQQSQDMAVNVANGAGGFIPAAQNVMMDAATGGAAQQVGGQAVNRLNNFGGRGALSGFANNPFQLNSASSNVLNSTANGDFMFGNPGFNAAVDAAIRKVQPTIASTFSSGGSGRLNSGLAKTAMTQAASDAFAGLFDSERNRQMSAANQLGNFQLAGNNQQIGAANSLANSDITSGSVLGSLANSERNRQMSAAQQLPQLGLLNSQIIGGVGDLQQSQNEREKLGSVQQMQTLLNAAFGGNPMALMGQTQSQPLHRNGLAGALGGVLGMDALAGSGVLGKGAAKFLGGPLGLIGGGLLGAFG